MENLKNKLTPMQYHVTQEEGTEPPFNNEYWNFFEEGLYVDIVSGEPLFSSKDKFYSSCGWPAFSRPINDSVLLQKPDYHIGYLRIEVRSTKANSHLGHVFDDGPTPEGTRYCINSASLRFIPKKDLINEGYAEYLSLFE